MTLFEYHGARFLISENAYHQLCAYDNSCEKLEVISGFCADHFAEIVKNAKQEMVNFVKVEAPIDEHNNQQPLTDEQRRELLGPIVRAAAEPPAPKQANPKQVAKLPRQAIGAAKPAEGMMRERNGKRERANAQGRYVTLCDNPLENDVLCDKVAKENGMCKGCAKGGIVKVDRGDTPIGEIFIFEGKRYYARAHANVGVCDFVDAGELCMIDANYQGKCKKHSPHWQCKHMDGNMQCNSIMISRDIGLCIRHGGKQ